MTLDEDLLGRALGRQWLEEAPQAVWLLDGGRQVLWLNRRARAMQAEGLALSAPQGVLQGRTAQVGVALEAAMRELAGPAGVRGDSRILRLPRAGALPALGFLSLVRLEGALSEPRYRLVVSDPGLASGIPQSRLLVDCFGFSPAEARVAVGLCEGLDVKRLARREGNSVNTIRSQVRGVLEKTRTTRQADLLRLLLSLPVGHCPAP